MFIIVFYIYIVLFCKLLVVILLYIMLFEFIFFSFHLYRSFLVLPDLLLFFVSYNYFFSGMDMANGLIRMVTAMRGPSFTMLDMGRVYIHGRMAIYIVENSMKINVKGREH